MRRALAAALALVATACSYDFKNPAEKLGMGQALGRAVVDRGGGGEPLAGALVALENSPSFNQATQSSGRFTLLSLPMGQHRVLFRKGTQWAASRVVEIAPGEDGKPEGVNLGDVRLRYTVTLQGTFSLPAGLWGGDFTNLLIDVTDEVSGQPASIASFGGGSYSYTFYGAATGPHRIRMAFTGDYDPYFTGTVERRTYTATPLSISVPETSEGQQLSLNSVPLDPEPPTSVLGSLRLRIQAVGEGGASAAAATSVALHDALSFDPLAPGSSLVETLSPDSAGYVQADEPAGLYLVRVIPPSPSGGIVWVEPDPVRLLVRSGERAELGTLYLVDSLTGSNAAFACFSDADCQGGTCVDYCCQGGSPNLPPPVVPFNVPFCDASECSSTPGQPCGEDRKGICLADCSGLPSGATPPMLCFPDAVSRRCTPDGVQASFGTFAMICP